MKALSSRRPKSNITKTILYSTVEPRKITDKIRDVSSNVFQQVKLVQIHSAGEELEDRPIPALQGFNRCNTWGTTSKFEFIDACCVCCTFQSEHYIIQKRRANARILFLETERPRLPKDAPSRPFNVSAHRITDESR